MNLNRAALIVSFLLLIFFVSTSAGFASVSSVQDQLRALQLKLVGEKIKQLQEAILNVGKPKPAEEEQSAKPTVEEMQSRIQTQIRALESLVASFKPQVIEERAALLEARIDAINQEIQAATGSRLAELQSDLENALADYTALRRDVRSALEASLKEQQIAALRSQIRVLQEKVLLLPRPAPQAAVPAPSASSPSLQYSVLREELQKAKLKLIQAQSAAIQEKINQLKAR
ncbi:MAG: hypothetical protein AAB915_00885 [Patescibacteria group bacterium]